MKRSSIPVKENHLHFYETKIRIKIFLNKWEFNSGEQKVAGSVENDPMGSNLDDLDHDHDHDPMVDPMVDLYI
jgi:hypothetical protein